MQTLDRVSLNREFLEAIRRGERLASRCLLQTGKVAVFLHIFLKSKKANLTKSELAMYSRAGQELAKLTDKELTALSAKRGWRELEI
jgi:hypothetical protein